MPDRQERHLPSEERRQDLIDAHDGVAAMDVLAPGIGEIIGLSVSNPNNVNSLMFNAVPHFLIIPIVAFNDRRPEPAFPRWAGYLNLFVFIIVLPGQLMFFFYSGPFAWNGLVGIWIPLMGFAVAEVCSLTLV